MALGYVQATSTGLLAVPRRPCSRARTRMPPTASSRQPSCTMLTLTCTPRPRCRSWRSQAERRGAQTSYRETKTLGSLARLVATCCRHRAPTMSLSIQRCRGQRTEATLAPRFRPTQARPIPRPRLPCRNNSTTRLGARRRPCTVASLTRRAPTTSSPYSGSTTKPSPRIRPGMAAARKGT